MFRKTSKFLPLAGLLLAALIGSSAGAANFTISNLNDGGAGSLREAIDAANNTPGADTITFEVSGTIVLLSTLPNVTDSAGLTIDGTGQNVTVSGNNSVQVMVVEAGAILNLQSLTIANGSGGAAAEGPGGGGILNNGTVTVTDSTFSSNRSEEGGGITNFGTLTITRSTFSNNAARFGGGILNNSTVTVTDSTFSSNNNAESGGGIFSRGTLTVTRCTFSGNNYTEFGGGILNNGTASVIDSTFVSNTSFEGGGISNSGTFTVTHSTFSGNVVSGGGGGISNNRILKVANSTFSDNHAFGGGGIISRGDLTITNSTLTGNSSPMGGGIYYSNNISFPNKLNLANTILANSPSGGDCFNDGNTINSSGVNLVEDGSCGASSDPAHFITGAPNLGPLADNGGPTLTHALLAGSPAIDAADNAVCPATDQRGVARPQDGNGDGSAVCDIGAYELEPAVDACTTAEVLDNFNRHDGPLGRNWRGQTNSHFYRIHDDQVDVGLGGPVFWNPDRFGTNQAAFVTLSRVDTSKSFQGALLKVQDGHGPYTGRNDHEDGKDHEHDASFGGAIAVVYDVQAQAVQVSTIRSGKRDRDWQSYGETPATFSDGDKLGACALANGDVRVYKNDVLVTTVTLDSADKSFFNNKGRQGRHLVAIRVQGRA